MDDLYLEIQQKTKELDVAIKYLRKSGSAYAQAEQDYKILLRTEALKLRDQGMTVGMIDKVVYGIPQVAASRFQRDCALTVYEANKESINSLKLQMRLLDAQLSREWSAAGGPKWTAS